MSNQREVEIFSAGCAVFEKVIKQIKAMACPSCEVTVLDMQDATVAKRAEAISVSSVPAVAIDGKLVDCCAGRGLDEVALRAAGLGQPQS